MKKNIKKSTSTTKPGYYRGNHDLPEVVDMDSLSYYDDDSLDRHHGRLQAEREKVQTDGQDTLPWEVEICYVQRELKIRSNRRAAHERYIRSNPDLYQENYSSLD